MGVEDFEDFDLVFLYFGVNVIIGVFFFFLVLFINKYNFVGDVIE